MSIFTPVTDQDREEKWASKKMTSHCQACHVRPTVKGPLCTSCTSKSREPGNVILTLDESTVIILTKEGLRSRARCDICEEEPYTCTVWSDSPRYYCSECFKSRTPSNICRNCSKLDRTGTELMVYTASEKAVIFFCSPECLEGFRKNGKKHRAISQEEHCYICQAFSG